jgi:hypothetical protein
VPERRLVLGAADADPAADLPGRAGLDLSVVLVVPSLVHLLQAGWVDGLRARGWRTFEAWLDAALAGGQDEPRGWRCDEVVAAWVEALGSPDRVHVVLGGAGEPEASAARVLSWPEVGMVEALLADLGDLDLVGRNAAEMVASGVDRLRRTEDVVPLGSCPLPQALQDRAATEARAMAARLDALGVQVSGDRAALDWPIGSAGTSGAVGLAAAAGLAMGALEQVAAWGREEPV